MRDEARWLERGRQQSIEPSLAIEHQRVVGKSVGMIVHVAPVEKEGSIFRRCHELVPFVSHRGCISPDFQHLRGSFSAALRKRPYGSSGDVEIFRCLVSLRHRRGIRRSRRCSRLPRKVLRRAPGKRRPTRNRRVCARCPFR